ncbi:hypothetical protein J3B02_000095 [Coemansia erecta]|uniref:WD40 repeat-like protein n=1 Tax=Coemansia asiatica TaxID=1052880 RepID=A0A9W8CMH3_9FUNG|nr:hypothetical protein LPJ64_000883 [Coemansia asiatica]KAJ2858714.1 hypothetical protein J3B02_000095 [Coemansia erecta]
MADEYTEETLDMLRKDPLNTALNPSVVRDFAMAKKFTDNKAPVTSLDFNLDGTFCITTSKDESLRIYDCMRGTREQVLYSKKYGCNLAQFTSQSGYVAYASTKINDTIRYLSFETNQYLRYFVGHKGFVTSLKRNPDGRCLMSAAIDGTVRLWDLNTVNPTSSVDVCGRDAGVSAAYDPSGMVVAVSVDSSQIRLFDVRELTRGPFFSWSIGATKATGNSTIPATVSGVTFVPPLGDFLMLAMTDGSVQTWNTQTGDFVVSLTPSPTKDLGHAAAIDKMRDTFLGQNLSVTPDGRTVLCGCRDGNIAYWDISRLLQNAQSDTDVPRSISPDGLWNGSHTGPVGVCAFNPFVMECFTAAISLSIWSIR